jgi:flagellin
LTIATKLRARAEGFMQALDNLGDSKNFLATAEGALQKINDILIKVRTKSQQAISDIMGSTERSDIEKEIEGYLAEISDINNETQWNGRKLLQISGGGADVIFQTGANADNTISFKFGRTTGHSSSNLHLDGVSNRGHVNSSSSAQAYMSSVDSAIASISVSLREVGSMMARLTFKEEQVTVAHANTEAAFSRIMNADIAREQVKATTFLILQQIATASLSQANANPQAVLALFR